MKNLLNAISLTLIQEISNIRFKENSSLVGFKHNSLYFIDNIKGGRCLGNRLKYWIVQFAMAD